MKNSTVRSNSEEVRSTMQWEMVELNRIKKIKNIKYSWPGQLAVYCQTVEITLYLTMGRV